MLKNIGHTPLTKDRLKANRGITLTISGVIFLLISAIAYVGYSALWLNVTLAVFLVILVFRLFFYRPLSSKKKKDLLIMATRNAKTAGEVREWLKNEYKLRHNDYVYVKRQIKLSDSLMPEGQILKQLERAAKNQKQCS